MTHVLTFEEVTHTYRIDDHVVPSVTQVIREVLAPDEYAGVSREVLDHAANRGRAVDRMIELDLKGELDPDSLHPELLPYWDAWQAFPDREAWQEDLARISQGCVFNSARGYGGTYDLYLPSCGALVDIKATALVPPTVGVQTAAYADSMALDDLDKLPAGVLLKRYCLHVTPTGCRLIPLTEKSDSADFLAALRVFRWRHRHDG